MYPFLKDTSFCPCFCFVHTIAQFSRILRFSHIYCQIFRIRTHDWRKLKKFKYGTFLTLSLKLMQWYVTSVSRGFLYEKVGNKCMKILKFWRTELSYAENKNKKMLHLGMDTCPSLNDIMKIRCNKCTRSEQGYDF